MEVSTLVFPMVMERLCRIAVIHPLSLKLLLTSTSRLKCRNNGGLT